VDIIDHLKSAAFRVERYAFRRKIVPKD